MAAKRSEKAIIKDLRGAVEEDWKSAIKFYGWALRQPETVRETAIDDLHNALGLPKADIQELVVGILNTKIATKIIGRHGQKSRLIWDYTLPSIAKAALGKSEGLTLITSGLFSATKANAGAIEHVFQLRPGDKARFSLPADLTSAEASRLAKFILTLPYGENDDAA